MKMRLVLEIGAMAHQRANRREAAADPAVLIGLIRNATNRGRNLEGHPGRLASARFSLEQSLCDLFGLSFEMLEATLLADSVHDQNAHTLR
jgi:hypothetical protein